MLAPTGAIAGLMPVSATDELSITSLKINKLEKIYNLHACTPLPIAFPQSAQRCRELASLPPFIGQNVDRWSSHRQSLRRSIDLMEIDGVISLSRNDVFETIQEL